MDGEWVPDGAKRVEEALISCLRVSEKGWIRSYEVRPRYKLTPSIFLLAVSRCDGLVNDDDFLVMVHPAPKTLAYVTALDDLAKWSMETCARNRHPPLTTMSGV
ncbi:hypothetical protein E4U32_000141 [Claviceps aff. humidiphila group G2b]|nr:hypothetical protein E4U32_000141 [Claviceps aff. humidiphila group G2b]